MIDQIFALTAENIYVCFALALIMNIVSSFTDEDSMLAFCCYFLVLILLSASSLS